MADDQDWAPGPYAKLAILLICAFIGAGTNIFIAASHKIEDKLGVRYLYISVTLFNESLKFVTVTTAYLLQRCCGCFGGTSGATHSGHGRITVRESLLFAVPAFLYMFDNNLIFVILRYVDPPTVAILWNIKILITAILFRLTFKKAFSRQKWIAVFLLLVGCITSQADKVAKTKPGSCAAKEQLAANITSTSHFVHDGGLHSVLKHKVTGTTHADMASNAVSDTGSGGTSSWMIGLLLILLGTTVTSLAGVYSEWVLKNTAKLPFFLQNMQMNGYGVLCNGIALVTLHWEDLVERGIFSGYNRFTAYTIVCQASFGILTAAVFKYLDNITNVYKNATTMMITMVLSAIYLDFHPTLTFVCGFMICCTSLLLYNVTPEWLASSNKGRESTQAQDYDQEGTGLLEAESDGDEHERGAVEMVSVSRRHG